MTNNIYGSFFSRLIGKSVDSQANLEEVNKEVESIKDEKLHIRAYKSSAVPTRGNIFKYRKRDDKLDEKIDSYLSI
ncbi:MAG: hypothetical protein ACJA2A_001939 [Cycloclasticus pugetii]|jgi:hypothetical protein|uniref:Uncharacterized protein n=1 Tax=Cycloclasticus zancles 78-ME TaxID=1198232 RepID=S5TXI4_9GAMM|nr:hypothetical protein CYCME_1369 [Cycloclasticus zancles 78-ME]SHJ69920.1 hypothetical protein SAMN05519226_0057 [Cycloclasticus pugetii]|tara:strand:+ start:8127 stop:8354 length:228 start_codon:yes stop_codon:yes gene_type:complete